MARGIHALLGRGIVWAAIALIGAPGCGGEEPGAGSPESPERRVETLSPGEIAGVATAINQGEIQRAQAALPNLTDPDVRDFAQQVITDHEKSEIELTRLLAQLGIQRQESTLRSETETLGQNMLRHIKREIPALSDQTYLEVQIFMHRKGVTVIDQRLLPAAASQPELQNYLDGLRTTIRQHLGRATILRKRYPPTDPGI